MWSVSLLRSSLVLILTILTLSCSDPIFWITSREQPITKNNLPKETQVTGIVAMGGNYYAAVGTSLWKRPVAGGEWDRIPLPTSIVNGVGATATAVYAGSHDGVFTGSGTSFTKLAGYNGSVAVYQVNTNIYYVGQDTTMGLLTVYNGPTFPAAPNFKVSGNFTGANAANAVGGSNGIFTDASGNIRYRFSWVSGFHRNFLYADSIVGEYNATAGTWTRQVNTGQPGNRGAAIFQLGNTHGAVKALYSVYGLGYFELYEDGGQLRVRSPESTIRDRDAYLVSDLAFSTITGFYENGPDVFAMTSRRGLWRLTAGVWYQE